MIYEGDKVANAPLLIAPLVDQERHGIRGAIKLMARIASSKEQWLEVVEWYRVHAADNSKVREFLSLSPTIFTGFDQNEDPIRFYLSNL